MLSAAPAIVVDLGAIAAALTAVVLFLGLIFRSRPFRWLWRHTISDPFAEWFRAQVAHEIEPRIAQVRAELRPNGGSSAYDRLSRRLDGLAADQRKIFAHLGAEGSLADEDDPDPHTVERP